MVSVIRTAVLVVSALAIAGAQSAAVVTLVDQASHKSKDAPKPAIPEEEAATPAPTPIPAMSPEDLPARPPHVSYRNGQLLVDSDNATLAEVLNAICKEMRVEIERPPNADSERVAAHLSGPPQQVIEKLLDDGKFGYIILSPVHDPNGIQRVILTGQTRGDLPKTAAADPMASHRAAMRPQAEPSPSPPATAEVQPASQPPPPAAQLAAAGGDTPSGEPAKSNRVESSDAQGPVQSAQNPDLSAQEKTPMQVLQDLYRRRQELQSQDQSQNSHP